MAVENFTGLANSGYYNNMPVSRIVDGFCVQTGLAAAKPARERPPGARCLPERGDRRAAPLSAGALATANGGAGGTGNLSQFYFVQYPQGSVSKADAAALKEAGMREAVADTYQSAGGAPLSGRQDSVFGQVIAGMDVLDAIAAVPAMKTVPPRP